MMKTLSILDMAPAEVMLGPPDPDIVALMKQGFAISPRPGLVRITTEGRIALINHRLSAPEPTDPEGIIVNQSLRKLRDRLRTLRSDAP